MDESIPPEDVLTHGLETGPRLPMIPGGQVLPNVEPLEIRPNDKETEPSEKSLWPAVKERLRQELNEQTFNTWVEPIQFLSLENNTLTLSVPDPFYADWLREHYHDLIRECTSAAGQEPEIRYVVRGSSPATSAPGRAPSPGKPPKVSAHIPGNRELNPNFSFERFVVGAGNRFAHAACIAVSEAPAKAYNPLFIYGQVGLGKTHLMQAVAHKMLKTQPDAKILYLPSERFTNLLINALQNRSMERFRERFRDVDILLVDDIPFIAGKEATMEEFFHTFNSLYDAHRQIVVSSDRPPKDIPDLEERLVSRFAWGLVTDIQPPDLETRVVILQSKLSRNNTVLPQDVIFFIATNVKSNIRELEGAMTRVIAYSSLMKTSVTLSVAREVLKDTVREEVGRISIDAIQKEVADRFQIKVSDLRARRRTKSVVYPRQVAMYLVRCLTEYSLIEIGQYFGGRDHSTVLYTCGKMEELIKADPTAKKMVDSLMQKIRLG